MGNGHTQVAPANIAWSARMGTVMGYPSPMTREVEYCRILVIFPGDTHTLHQRYVKLATDLYGKTKGTMVLTLMECVLTSLPRRLDLSNPSH